jgi:hypothetical protein
MFAVENSNKFPKTRFSKEKSGKDVVTLECLPFTSSKRNCDVPLVWLERSCNGYKYILQNNVICSVHPTL